MLIATALLFILAGSAVAKAAIAPALTAALKASKSAKSGSAASTPYLTQNADGLWKVNFIYDPAKVVPSELKKTLEAAGVQGPLPALKLNLIQGWAKPSQLETLSQISGVTFVGLPRPVFYSSGSVQTQGDAVVKADQARQTFGMTGQGVKVGVISNGIQNCSQAIDSGDFPSSYYMQPLVYQITWTTTTHDETVLINVVVTSGTQPNVTTVTKQVPTVVTITDVTSSSKLIGGGAGSGDEGTAMAEIVHDVAPNAGIGFAPASTETEFLSAIDALVNDFGANVIVDDLDYRAEPVFEFGPLAQACQEAVRNHGVHYITAAGNNAQTHYDATFHRSTQVNLPSTTGDLQDFGNGHNYMDLGTYSQLQAATGGTLNLWLYWNDPFDSPTSNYNLRVYLSGASTPLQATSSNLSYAFYDHTVSAALLSMTVPYFASNQKLMLAVERTQGTASHFKILGLPSCHEFAGTQQAYSIVGHASAPEVLTVGAYPYYTTSTLEAFSSWGPSLIYYPAAAQTSKPDFLAPDGVAVSGAGGFTTSFFGTSAAAAHTAGVAALLLEKTPSLTPAKLQTLLGDTSDRMSTAGFNYSEGYGRINALSAMQKLANNGAQSWLLYQ